MDDYPLNSGYPLKKTRVYPKSKTRVPVALELIRSCSRWPLRAYSHLAIAIVIATSLEMGNMVLNGTIHNVPITITIAMCERSLNKEVFPEANSLNLLHNPKQSRFGIFELCLTECNERICFNKRISFPDGRLERW